MESSFSLSTQTLLQINHFKYIIIKKQTDPAQIRIGNTVHNYHETFLLQDDTQLYRWSAKYMRRLLCILTLSAYICSLIRFRRNICDINVLLNLYCRGSRHKNTHESNETLRLLLKEDYAYFK